MVRRIDLLALACLLAGLYGALHNQVSYTVSPAYFHAIKFEQFDIPAGLRNRLGAACVGFLASWWMGAIVGGVVILAGLVVLRGEGFVRGVLRAFGVVVGTAVLAGLAALAFGWAAIPAGPESSANLFTKGWRVEDHGALYRAMVLHTASYWGGAVGGVAGCVYIVWRRLLGGMATEGTQGTEGRM